MLLMLDGHHTGPCEEVFCVQARASFVLVMRYMRQDRPLDKIMLFKVLSANFVVV